MTKKRLTFECWNCSRSYSLLRNPIENKKLFVACPFCGQEAVVDLAPYPKKTVQVFKDVSQGRVIETFDLELPEILPTQKPPDEESES
jgi:hypothetical protein